MGQLWEAVICKQDTNGLEDCRFFSPRCVWTSDGKHIAIGAKLLEHAWIGNPFCLAIENILYQSTHRVLWLGEYTSEQEMKEFAEAAGSAPIPSKAPKGDSCRITFSPNEFDICGKFLVNHSAKEYVDVGKYVERLAEIDSGVIDPLPLLTATSNDRGGGDYFGSKGRKFIDSWAWHFLSVEDEAPSGSKEIRPLFVDDI